MGFRLRGLRALGVLELGLKIAGQLDADGRWPKQTSCSANPNT